MFPTSLESPYQHSRGRRRGRNQPNNRDYICPCGKSYLSYPALFTHIKIKHNGRAPGQIIKPRSENPSRRGRPRAKEVYDSESDTEDIAANCIDRLCDFVTDIEKWDDNGKLKEIYMKDDFYQLYVNFNPQEQEAKFDQAEELFEETCDNVFCELLAEINKRLNQPYYFDILFIFFMMLARTINENTSNSDSNEDKSFQENQNESENALSSSEQKIAKVQTEMIRNIVHIINGFVTHSFLKYREEYELEGVPLFSIQNMAKLIEYFFNWLTNRKYLCFKLKINQNFNLKQICL